MYNHVNHKLSRVFWVYSYNVQKLPPSFKLASFHHANRRHPKPTQPPNMRFSVASTLALLTSAVSAASSWTFADGKFEVLPKTGADATASNSGVFTDKERVKQTVELGHTDKIKITLTTKEGSKAKRPHQAFLMLKEASGLEAPYALTVKESGKGTVEIVSLLPPVGERDM